MPSSSSRRPARNLASPSTSRSHSKNAHSPCSSHSSDGPSTTPEPTAFELRTVSLHEELPSKEEPGDEDEVLLHSARRPSFDSVQSYELYTPDEDRAVIKKLDRKLVITMAFLYMLSFLDRSSE